jgi:hypothetical protein
LNRQDAEHAKKKVILSLSFGVLGVLAVDSAMQDRAPRFSSTRLESVAAHRRCFVIAAGSAALAIDRP